MMPYLLIVSAVIQFKDVQEHHSRVLTRDEGAETDFWLLKGAFKCFLFAIDAHVFNNLQALTTMNP